MKQMKENIFWIYYAATQIIIFIVHPQLLNLLILLLINLLFLIYLHKKQLMIMILIAGIMFFVSFYLAGIFNKQNLFITNPFYLEAINQMRGATGESQFGKIIYNKLLYFYFYLRNFTQVFDLYYLVEKIGIVTGALLIIGIIKQFKKITLKDYLLFLIPILPLGLNANIQQTTSFILFIPLMSYVISKLLIKISEKKSMTILFFALILNIIQLIWQIKVVL